MARKIYRPSVIGTRTIVVTFSSFRSWGMVGSCFVVQFITDYIDRVLYIAVAAVLITALRKSMKENFA